MASCGLEYKDDEQRPHSSYYCKSLTLSLHCLLQDPSERSDRGGGRDQLGGSHPELRRLGPAEHLRNRQVRVALRDSRDSDTLTVQDTEIIQHEFRAATIRRWSAILMINLSLQSVFSSVKLKHLLVLAS